MAHPTNTSLSSLGREIKSVASADFRSAVLLARADEVIE
jgi:hypothetical protein